MRNLLIFLLGFLFLSFKGNKTYSSEVFLDLKFTGKAILYNSTDKKKIIRTLSHDFKNEDFLTFTIYKSNDSMYYVNASYAIAGKNVTGWISKTTRLRIFSKAYNRPFLLYNFYNNKSSFNKLSYTSNALEIIDFKKGWLKVKLKNKGNVVSGWILPEDQCGNPYTTCN